MGDCCIVFAVLFFIRTMSLLKNYRKYEASSKNR